MTNSNKNKPKKTVKKQINVAEKIDETRNLDILGSKKEKVPAKVKKEKNIKEEAKEIIEPVKEEAASEIEEIEEEKKEAVDLTTVEITESFENEAVIPAVIEDKIKENEVVDVVVEDAEADMKKKNKKTPASKKNSKWTRSNTIITVGIVLIMIPILLLLWVLLSASSGTGKVILGDRFEGDLDPAITSAQITEIDDSLSNLDGVTDVEVILKVATLRVYIQAEQIEDAADYVAMMETAYEEIVGILPEETYFTLINNTKKQYDLEIHVYTANTEYDSDDFVYYIMNKSSIMEEPNVQLVSEPLNPELAEELRQAVIDRLNPPEESDEDIVGNPDEDPGSVDGTSEDDPEGGAGE